MSPVWKHSEQEKRIHAIAGDMLREVRTLEKHRRTKGSALRLDVLRTRLLAEVTELCRARAPLGDLVSVACEHCGTSHLTGPIPTSEERSS